MSPIHNPAHPFRRRLLPVALALATVLLSIWVIPAQMQAPEDPPTAYEVCGNPRLEAEMAELRRTVEWRPLTVQELQAQGRASASGQALADTVGQGRQFWASDFTVPGTFYSITATCKAVGAHAYLYLEDGEPVEQSVLDNIINEFDTNIYAEMAGTFGSEPNPGVDLDARVYLLLLDIRDGWTPGSGYIAGYFYSLNELTNANLAAISHPYAGYSNEKEMLYIDTSPATPGSVDSYGTVAHEFQHMIHWWMDSAGLEETWVDEGCADLAQYVCGYGHPRSHLYTGAPTYPGFLEDPDHQLTLTGNAWNTEPNILASYGAAYMWTLYLWEHYGGDTTIQQLVDEDADGITAVNNVLAARGYADNFEAAFRKWVVANYLDDGTGAYGYSNIELLAAGAPNFVTSFPRPLLAATHSSYPLGSTGGTLEYWAGDAVKLTGTAGSNLDLTFDGDDDNRFGATVVRSTSATFSPGTNTVSHVTLNGTWYGTTTVHGAQAVLLIPSSLTDSGASGYSYGASLSALTADNYNYLPLVMAPAAPTPIPGPRPGHWISTDGYTDFYVTPDRLYVRNFRDLMWFNDGYVDCGWWYITHQADVPITSSHFSFSGPFYAQGTFTSQTSANISVGYDNYYLCNIHWYGGPWPLVATWRDYSQPSAAVEAAEQLSAQPAGTPEPAAERKLMIRP